MIDVAFRNLWVRKTRSMLCILAVMIAVYLNGSTATMNNWMYQTMTAELARYIGKIYVQQSGSGYPPFDSTIDQKTAESVLAREELGLNSEESTALIFISTERAMMPFMPAKAAILGVPIGKESALFGDTGAASGVRNFPQAAGFVTILGADAVDYFNASTGKNITINGKECTVIGILERSSSSIVNISAVVPLTTAQNLFGKEGVVSAVMITPDDVNKVEEISGALKESYPLLEVNTQSEMLAEAEKILQFPQLYMSIMSVTAFIVAVVIVMSTMVMAVMERTREIGVLRAIGASRRRIVVTILVEVVMLSLIGGIPGALLSVPMAEVMKTTLPEASQLAEIVLKAVVAGMVGSLYPAWRAMRVSPVEALRYE